MCSHVIPPFLRPLTYIVSRPAIMGEILVEAPSGEVADEEVICILLHPAKEGADEEDSSA